VRVEVAPAYIAEAGERLVGALPATTEVNVAVGLALPNPSSLQGLISSVYSPGTPEYRHFLTATQLTERFGPSPSSVSEAQSYFERFGLSVHPSPDHLVLTVTGPSSEVAAAFGTTFEEYRATNGRTFVSHPTPASLPAVAPWTGALGLGNASPIVPALRTFPRSPASVTPAASCSGSGGALLPCQIWGAYGMVPLLNVGTNGSGVRLAVVDPYSSGEVQPQLAADLAALASQSGISAGQVNYVYPDPAPGDLNSSVNLGWSLEDALDLEWARAAAPGATVDMTFSPDRGPGLYEAVDWLVAHQAADVISMSWGEPDVGVFNQIAAPCVAACNASTDGSYGLLSPVLAFAAAEGISVFAASGDCGSADGTAGVSTNFPASDPDVTGVGGTVLSVATDGTYQSETAWSGNATGAQSPGCNNQGGSGGGFSPFPRPWWQSGPVHPTRGVPDLALDAATPALLFFHGSTASVGGTSLGTPVWAGIVAIADEYAHGRLGLLNPSLYAISQGPNYTRDFHDIVSGSNGYSAGTGWDPVTGLGSPQAFDLVHDLSHRIGTSTSSLATFVYASPRFGAAPLTVTFHVAPAGGTGTYPLEGVSFGEGNASFAVGGATAYTYQFPGVYAAQSYVSDSIANFSVSPPILVVVGGGTAFSTNLTASTQLPATGAAVQLSVVSSGGIAPYHYNFSFGDGTYLLDSPRASTNHTYGASGSFCAAVIVSDSAAPSDGGASARIAVGVGGAPLPNCRNDTVPLTMMPAPNVGVRDAPADFPQLFSISGGSTVSGTLSPSVALTASDPYLGACGCAIFRAAGDYRVTGYGSDSENEEVTAVMNVTVAPSLTGNFSLTPAFGPAPLTVHFHASVTGGYSSNVTATVWTFGNGATATGASASTTYTTPGLYLATGQLSDRGHGNASEAFLIDVGFPGGTSGPVRPAVTATVDPALDVPLGATVNMTARAISANGTVVPAGFLWGIASHSGSYRPALNWTYSPSTHLRVNDTLGITVNVTDPTTGLVVRVALSLAHFGAIEPGGFLPRVDGLSFSDSGGPPIGPAPLHWNGSGIAVGPGTTSVVWAFGDGYEISDPIAVHPYPVPGFYTIVTTARDSWGDSATDVHPVVATGPLVLHASLSANSGTPPLTLRFGSAATGGVGGPYEFRWSFGDNSSASSENGTHVFPATGVYRVDLRASDLANDSASMNWTVSVQTATAPAPTWVLLVVAVGAGSALAVIVRRRSAGGAPPIP